MEEGLLGMVTYGVARGAIVKLHISSTLDHVKDVIGLKLGLVGSELHLTYTLKEHPGIVFNLHSDEDVHFMMESHAMLNTRLISLVATCITSRSSQISSHFPKVGPSQPAELSQLAMKICPEDEDANAFISCRTQDLVDNGLQIPAWWHDVITVVGQEFEDAKEVRQALAYYSIAKNFNFHFKKNSTYRVTVECAKASGGCPWRLHASRMRHSQRFSIKTMNSTHSCGGGIGSACHPRASKKFIAALVKPTLKHRPTYRAVDLMKDLHKNYGIKMPYKRAWMGKELACDEVFGAARYSYDQLRW